MKSKTTVDRSMHTKHNTQTAVRPGISSIINLASQKQTTNKMSNATDNKEHTLFTHSKKHQLSALYCNHWKWNVGNRGRGGRHRQEWERFAHGARPPSPPARQGKKTERLGGKERESKRERERKRDRDIDRQTETELER